MELFPDSKGYATRENAIAKLKKTLPQRWFDDRLWLIVALPNGRFQLLDVAPGVYELIIASPAGPAIAIPALEIT